MARISLYRPSLPSDVPYQATRPASGIAASSVAGAVGYEAAVRALRSHVQPFQWMDPLADDIPQAAAETRFVAYRPSPFATALYVGIWYASAFSFGVTAPGAAPKLDVSLIADAGGATVDQFTIDELAQPRDVSRGANLAASGLVDTTGLLAGREQYASNMWTETPLDVTGLAGADGWIEVEATACQVLAVGWVEVVSAEV